MTSNNLDFVARCMIGHNKTDIKSIKTELENVQKQVGTNKNNILFTATIGKCESTGGTANKVVTVSDVNYTPHKGSIIAVKFKYSNNVIDTVEHPITLNVNNTGAYRIWYKNGDYVNASQGKTFGLSGYYIYYMYDGVDRWVWINYCMDNTYSLMPQTEASAGTATNERLISAKVLSDTIDEKLKTVETAIPTTLAELSGDSTHRTVTDTEKATWNAKADVADIPTVPITAIQKNGIGVTPVSGTVNIIVPTTAADVSALPDTTKYATALSLTINSSTFVMTGQLKDQNGDNLGTAQTIDLPLESVVVGGSYNSQTKKVVLTLQNGNTIEFSVADLVSGLQTELSMSNKLNPAFIEYDSTHRAVSDTEKATWNSKQNAIDSSHKLSADNVDDTNATNKFATAEELEQIQTNKNNILTVADQTTKYNLLNQAAYTELRNVAYNNGVVTQVNTDTRSNLVMQLSLFNNSTFVAQLAQATVRTNGIVSIPFTYSQEGNLIRIGHSGANTDARIVYAVPTDFVVGNKYYFVCTVSNCEQVIDDVTTPYSWQNMAIIPKAIYDSGFTSYQPYTMNNAELTAAIQALQAQLTNQ